MKKPPFGGFFRPRPFSQLNDDGEGGVVGPLQQSVAMAVK
jgi:hypothetical protein